MHTGCLSYAVPTPEWRLENQELMRKYRREWYCRNKERGKESVVLRLAELRLWFRAYKSNCSCMLCGETHPACLQFHHRNAEEKELEVSVAVASGWSKKRILEEIAKCDVLCANCHAKIHWKE